MSSRSKRRPAIFILTGDVQAGKTTWLKQFVQELRAQSLRHHGFLSEAVMEGGRTVGYNLYDLESRSSAPFLRDKGEDGWERTGPFFFIPSGLARAREIIARRETDSLLIVDEVGPVELLGRGIWPALEQVLFSSGPISLLVIRKSILEDFFNILPRERVRVFELSSADIARRLLDEITRAMAKIPDRGTGAGTRPSPNGTQKGEEMVRRDLVNGFSERAVAAGAEVERSGTLEEARSFVKRFIQENKIKKVMASSEAAVIVPQDLGLSFLTPDRTEACGAAELGLVFAHWGIAETGTLVHLDASDEERIIWTLPPICMAWLETQKIVPDIESLAPVIAGHLAHPVAPSPQVSLITGPSRTADIENVLSIGVHGPGRLIVILVEANTR